MTVKSKTFGEILQGLRQKNHITQRQLAYFIGVSDKVISKWESGVSLPRADVLPEIARFFGVSADMLLCCDDTQKADAAIGGSAVKAASKPRMLKGEVPIGASFIPDVGGWRGNYLCSWGRQGGVAAELGITGAAGAASRDALSEETLFGDTNYYHILPREQRAEVIFLLDDGWDVPFGTPNDAAHRHLFGTVAPDPERFPTFGDTPAKRLTSLCRRVEELGYAGAGLWISIQQAGVPQEKDNAESARPYWEERARRCHEAGVRYWKVDWGNKERDDAYCRMMTEAARKFAPELWVEHASPRFPFTAMSDPEQIRLYPICAHARLPISDVFRVYDVCDPFETVCLLDRIDIVLRDVGERKADARGLINAESSPLIAAALGCTYGIMQAEPDTAACLRWQRLSPPFGAFDSDYHASAERLSDHFFFEHNICGNWIPTAGCEITESAPAVMARGCALPTVETAEEHPPFVIASRNPETGAYAVATLRRTIDPNRNRILSAAVTLKVEDLAAPVGVFGWFDTLTLQYPVAVPKGAAVWVQDMLSDNSIEVTGRVKAEGNTLIFDGRDLRMWGKAARGEKDSSTPSLIICIK